MGRIALTGLRTPFAAAKALSGVHGDRRFSRHQWKSWDAQVESDVRSGKLDKVIAEADTDYRAGRTRPL